MITKELFNVKYSITDYEEASNLIVNKALKHETFSVSALAVHGLMESVKNKAFQNTLSKVDLIVPDGQPVKWALNSFFKVGLKDRVAGPTLTLHVLSKANELGLRVFLYGSELSTLEKIIRFTKLYYPNLTICGIHPDRFREATPEEDKEDTEKINGSDADIVLVGRGCPRQEKWVADHRLINAPMLAVGAAFDFMAGNIKHAPKWAQDYGMEWFYRLIQDPKKLWKRYLVTNSHFIYLFLIHKAGLRKTALQNLN